MYTHPHPQTLPHQDLSVLESSDLCHRFNCLCSATGHIYQPETLSYSTSAFNFPALFKEGLNFCSSFVVAVLEQLVQYGS